MLKWGYKRITLKRVVKKKKEAETGATGAAVEVTGHGGGMCRRELKPCGCILCGDICHLNRIDYRKKTKKCSNML